MKRKTIEQIFDKLQFSWIKIPILLVMTFIMAAFFFCAAEMIAYTNEFKNWYFLNSNYSQKTFLTYQYILVSLALLSYIVYYTRIKSKLSKKVLNSLENCDDWSDFKPFWENYIKEKNDSSASGFLTAFEMYKKSLNNTSCNESLIENKKYKKSIELFLNKINSETNNNGLIDNKTCTLEKIYKKNQLIYFQIPVFGIYFSGLLMAGGHFFGGDYFKIYDIFIGLILFPSSILINLQKYKTISRKDLNTIKNDKNWSDFKPFWENYIKEKNDSSVLGFLTAFENYKNSIIYEILISKAIKIEEYSTPAATL